MDFSLSGEQESIRAAIRKICARFDADYWLRKDRDGGFPHDFYAAFVAGRWLGIAIPEEFGGAGLGVTEAALMMQGGPGAGAGRPGAPARHRTIFGVRPAILVATAQQHRAI